MDKKDLLKIPNLISVSRLLGSALILIFTFISIDKCVVGIIYVYSVLSDKLDGTLARLLKQETELGKKLEPLADVSLVYSIFTYLTFKLDFPLILYRIALLVLVFGFILNLILNFIKREWFVPSFLAGKIMIAIVHLCCLAIFLQIPYHLELLWLTIISGILVFLYYLYKLFSFAFKRNK